MADPWDIWDSFNRQLAAKRLQEQRIVAQQQNQLTAAEIARSNATTLFGRQLARDEIKYDYMDQKTAAEQDFRHKENYLTNVTYKRLGGRAGRRGHVGNVGGLPGEHGAGPSGGSYSNAIAGIESGGNYGAVGVVTNGDRPYGKHQVMGRNVGPWTREVLGVELSPQQFLASPEAQERVFEAKFGQYVQQYGPEGAAQAWFGGPGSVGRPGGTDKLGTSVGSYGKQFVANLGPGGAAQDALSNIPEDLVWDKTGMYRTGQRRYTADSTGIPSYEELMAEEEAGTGDSMDDFETPWSDEDFAANGITPWDRARIDPNMDVMGTQFFSGAQIEMMPQDMQNLLLPIGGLSPTETNQYLVLRAKPGTLRDPYGNPLPDTPDMQGAAAAATGTPQTLPPGSVQAPVPQLQTIPTQKRTRRNEAGQLEFLVDDQWRPSGG